MNFIIISIVLLIISFIIKAYMDLSSENKLKSLYWNKGKTWVLKYKFPLLPAKREWYYLWLYKPKYKEKFKYSTTILVLFTDGWHTLQFMFLNCIFATISVNIGGDLFSIIVTFIFIRLLYSIFFNIFYNKKQ